MTIKGYRLQVNLSASQVRRRLKGYGFGVRRVESAGNQSAVIIHTATGDHERKLRNLFRDVLPRVAPAPSVDEHRTGDELPHEPTEWGDV